MEVPKPSPMPTKVIETAPERREEFLRMLGNNPAQVVQELAELRDKAKDPLPDVRLILSGLEVVI